MVRRATYANGLKMRSTKRASSRRASYALLDISRIEANAPGTAALPEVELDGIHCGSR